MVRLEALGHTPTAIVEMLGLPAEVEGEEGGFEAGAGENGFQVGFAPLWPPSLLLALSQASTVPTSYRVALNTICCQVR